MQKKIKIQEVEKEKAPDRAEAGVLDLSTEDLQEEICERFVSAFYDFVKQYPNAKFQVVRDHSCGELRFGFRSGEDQKVLLLFDIKLSSIVLESDRSIPEEFRQSVFPSLLDFLKK